MVGNPIINRILHPNFSYPIPSIVNRILTHPVPSYPSRCEPTLNEHSADVPPSANESDMHLHVIGRLLA